MENFKLLSSLELEIKRNKVVALFAKNKELHKVVSGFLFVRWRQLNTSHTPPRWMSLPVYHLLVYLRLCLVSRSKSTPTHSHPRFRRLLLIPLVSTSVKQSRFLRISF